VKRIFIITFVVLLFFGCGRRARSLATYQAQLKEIEHARENNEITTAEYLRLKQDAENAHEDRITPRGSSSSTYINNYQAPASTYKPPVSRQVPLNAFQSTPAFRNATYFGGR
jgi:hypothetical protein